MYVPRHRWRLLRFSLGTLLRGGKRLSMSRHRLGFHMTTLAACSPVERRMASESSPQSQNTPAVVTRG